LAFGLRSFWNAFVYTSVILFTPLAFWALFLLERFVYASVVLTEPLAFWALFFPECFCFHFHGFD
jgi:hypothetical protein